MPRKGQKYTRPPPQPWGPGKKAAAVICVIIFIIGAILTIGGWATMNSDDPTLTVEERTGGGNGMIVGIIMMIAPIALAMGLSSGTGRPYGGKMYKGMGGY